MNYEIFKIISKKEVLRKNEAYYPFIMNPINLAPNQCIAIYPQAAKGLGDYATAAAFAENFFRHGLSREQIVFVSEEPQNFALFNQRNFQIISEDELRKRVKEVALLVIGPCTLTYPSFIDLKTPTLGFYEYDYENEPWNPHIENWAKTNSLGIGKDNMGMWIEPELVEWTSNPDSKNPLKRLEPLSALPPNLQRAILGDLYSEETVRSFHETKRLYFGHAYRLSSQKAFIHALGRIAPNHEIIVVMPGYARDDYRIREYDWVEDVYTEKGNHSSITVIRGLLPYPHMKKICMAAQKETVATGDGSLALAISASTNFVYERLEHKRKLGSALLEEYGGHNRPIFYPEIPPDFVDIWGKRNLEEFEAVNQRIIQTKDAALTVIPFIDRFLKESREAIYPIDYPDKDEDLPYDQVVFVSTFKLCSLQIRGDTGESDLLMFQDSTFEIRGAYPGKYTLIRRKKYPLITDQILIEDNVSKEAEPTCYQKIVQLFCKAFGSLKEKTI